MGKQEVFAAAIGRRHGLLLCAAMLIIPLAAEAQEPAAGRRPAPQPATRRTVIAPPSASLADPSAVLRAVLPYTPPPPRLAVVARDGVAVEASPLEWLPAGEMPGTLELRFCKCPNEWRLCPAWPCADCCRVIVRKLEDGNTSRASASTEPDQLLARAGLRRARGAVPRPVVEIPVYEWGGQPQQYISCIQKDSNGNCIHWRICGTTTSGVYRCYDVVKDPVFGWVVTWE
ncbi:MAG: hypothetical protein N2036_07595 [Bryobacteraceae bacterium]|nr:hypothetical protein [Bryobacteraceae bacterium]